MYLLESLLLRKCRLKYTAESNHFDSIIFIIDKIKNVLKKRFFIINDLF